MTTINALSFIYTQISTYISIFSISFVKRYLFLISYIHIYIYIYQNIFFGKNWKHETFEACKRITKNHKISIYKNDGLLTKRKSSLLCEQICLTFQPLLYPFLPASKRTVEKIKIFRKTSKSRKKHDR